MLVFTIHMQRIWGLYEKTWIFIFRLAQEIMNLLLLGSVVMFHFDRKYSFFGRSGEAVEILVFIITFLSCLGIELIYTLISMAILVWDTLILLKE